MSWVHALMTHATPTVARSGSCTCWRAGLMPVIRILFDQALQGRSLISTGPHLMIAGADAAFYDAYPKSADPDTSAPYVMWAGTPYQHLMVRLNRRPPAALEARPGRPAGGPRA